MDRIAIRQIRQLTKADVAGLRTARDQLFAEAVAAFNAGEQWWPDQEFEQENIKPQQDDRFEGDPWEEAIRAYVATLSRVRITDIARNVFMIETAKIGTSEQRRIAAVLTGLGWTPVRDWQGRAYASPADHVAQ